MSISTEFAELLRAGRPQFNARVAEAHHRYRGFNTDEFTLFLQECVDPMIVNIDAANRGAFASSAFDIALDLVGRELTGAHPRGKLLTALWQDTLPTLTSAMADRPSLLISALCNALLNLEALPAARPNQWLELLRKYGGSLTAPDDLLQLGVLAAWRAGAAHFRLPALQAAARLPHIGCTLLDLTPESDMQEQLRLAEQNPWLIARSDKALEVGAFTGLGGQFAEPPEVRATHDGFIVKSSDRCFQLIADGFGAVLLPATQAEFDSAGHAAREGRPPKLSANTLIYANSSVVIPLPADGLQLTWNAYTAALTSPYSFSISIVPLL
ncbi:MAG: hypothetical protein COB09_09885 [Thalassobium sp.]|uniref:Uncharacterized protein n=1 Tax=Thalassolituus pacificus TaxID=2975440 RepID=A0A9X3AQS3_9GAMM|nr:hypothetical protein [Thalassolituus pacificus]MCT7358054.1 hypothetical protein [Thalassolituus pacificus]PHS63551.1 MAG: hypothetical protein COB09_09885 [Thalassobium sp.]